MIQTWVPAVLHTCCHVMFSFGWSRSLTLKALAPSMTRDPQSLQATKNVYLGALDGSNMEQISHHGVDVNGDVDGSQRVLIVRSLQASI